MIDKSKLGGLVALLLVGGLSAAAPHSVAMAQEAGAVVRGAEGAPVVRVEVAARVLNDGDDDVELEPAPPGGVITLVEGQKARLRMAALRRNDTYAYPGTRFTIDGNRGTLTIIRANEEFGSLVVVANHSNERPRLTVRFEILDRLNIDPDLRTGHIEVEVVPERRLEPEPKPEPKEARGVTLYEHGEFRGRSTRFTTSVRDLRGTYVGNDTVSSVRVDPGCRLVLYEHQDYKGKATVLAEDVTYLGGSRVGNDTASSLELECSDPETRRGIVLYDAEGFRGAEEIFYADDPDLRDNRIGDDRVRSLRVDRGCRATLYELPAYRGRSLVVEQGLDSLRRTEIGDDEVSSLRVDCRWRREWSRSPALLWRPAPSASAP